MGGASKGWASDFNLSSQHYFVLKGQLVSGVYQIRGFWAACELHYFFPLRDCSTKVKGMIIFLYLFCGQEPQNTVKWFTNLKMCITSAHQKKKKGRLGDFQVILPYQTEFELPQYFALETFFFQHTACKYWSGGALNCIYYWNEFKCGYFSHCLSQMLIMFPVCCPN